MAKYQELADQSRAGAFDAARRMIKVQEDVLGAVESYQNKVAAEVRTPWSLVKANYDLAKQVADIQTEAALDWTSAFGRSAQQSARKATTKSTES
jgi:hypothetical protein